MGFTLVIFLLIILMQHPISVSKATIDSINFCTGKHFFKTNNVISITSDCR